MKRRIFKRYKTRKKGGQHYRVNYGFFTPARRTEPYELISAKKFGKENLKQLPRIGKGSDREVYELGPDKVLKIARTPRGLLQNDAERGLSDYNLPDDTRLDVFEIGKDYVVAEKAVRDDKKTGSFLKPLKQFTQGDFNNKTGELQNAMEDLGLSDYMYYDLLWNDFKAPRNWGMIRGKPSLIDGGALNRHTLGDFSKDDKIPQETRQEWEEIKKERKLLRK